MKIVEEKRKIDKKIKNAKTIFIMATHKIAFGRCFFLFLTVNFQMK